MSHTCKIVTHYEDKILELHDGAHNFPQPVACGKEAPHAIPYYVQSPFDKSCFQKETGHFCDEHREKAQKAADRTKEQILAAEGRFVKYKNMGNNNIIAVEIEV